MFSAPIWSAEEVAEAGDADGPEEPADDVVGEEGAVVHLADAGEDRRERAHDRHEAGEHDRLGAVLVEELVGLVARTRCLKSLESGRRKSDGPTCLPNQ